MSWVVSETFFVFLVRGALVMTGLGALVLIGAFARDAWRKSTW